MISLRKKKDINGDDDLEEILATIDTARHYHLTSHEMREACDRFVNSKQKVENLQTQQIKVRKKKRQLGALLPELKVGLTLYRKDKRRGSSCNVLAIEGQKVTIVWVHSGRKSQILMPNLRNPSLYACKEWDRGMSRTLKLEGILEKCTRRLEKEADKKNPLTPKQFEEVVEKSLKTACEGTEFEERFLLNLVKSFLTLHSKRMSTVLK